MASRLGGRASGLHANLASWEGAVDVELYEHDGKDYVRVSLNRHHGHGTDALIYQGPIGEYKNKIAA